MILPLRLKGNAFLSILAARNTLKELIYLGKFFLRYKWRLILGLIFVFISNFFSIYPAQYVRNAFNLIKEQLNKTSAPEGNDLLDTLVKYALLILLMAVLKGVFMFLMRQTIIVMSRLIEGDMKQEIFDHYLALSPAFYKRNNTGDLMNRLSEDVSRVRMFIGPAVMYLANLSSTFIFVIVMMLQVDPLLTAYVLIPLPFLSFVVYKVSASINKKSERLQQKLSAISTFAQESFAGIRVIKAFALEQKWSGKFGRVSGEYREKALDLSRTDSFFTPVVASITGLSSVIIIWVGGNMVLEGKISVGNIPEFIIYVNLLIWPVTSLGWISSLMQRAAASQKRINEFLKEKPEIESPRQGTQPESLAISFNQVSFTYPDTGIRALHNLSFAIPEGGSIGIVGPAGSGKSSITALLMRFYDCSEGSIRIGNTDLRKLDLQQWRSKMGYVPQESFLFSETIFNNIAFGAEGNQTENAVKQAAQMACIHESIIGFPEGYQTIVGERGITLSGGQKQRISIARAILKNPDFLILDDSLSAVDTETEDQIIRNFKSLSKNRSSLIISHRISSVMHCDQIIVLEQGQIIERGNHEELLASGGIYAELFRKQRLESTE